MRRIRNKKHGLKEKEAIQLVYDFVIFRITYGRAYFRFNKAEMGKINALIPKAYNNPLGAPEHTSTDNMLQLGLHNTIKELIDA